MADKMFTDYVRDIVNSIYPDILAKYELMKDYSISAINSVSSIKEQIVSIDSIKDNITSVADNISLISSVDEKSDNIKIVSENIESIKSVANSMEIGTFEEFENKFEEIVQ
jgi:hypothetical protein